MEKYNHFLLMENENGEIATKIIKSPIKGHCELLSTDIYNDYSLPYGFWIVSITTEQD